jgi:ubiquinone/menaquinone biosynthesis C-methylase UbiE
LYDDELLAQPLIQKLEDVPAPFVLDFATGTGRLSYALLSRPEFNGRIVAIDLSQGMLEQARSKLSRHLDRVDLLRHPSLPLPFPDAAFDVVCCLEVLELMPDIAAALQEMSRLLRPGGILLTSRGTEESGRKAKVKSRAELTSILQSCGFENVQITKWWKLFDRVLANRNGTSRPVGVKSLVDVLQCPACGQTRWVKTSKALKCEHCSKELPVTPENIILN